MNIGRRQRWRRLWRRQQTIHFCFFCFFCYIRSVVWRPLVEVRLHQIKRYTSIHIFDMAFAQTPNNAFSFVSSVPLAACGVMVNYVRFAYDLMAICLSITRFKFTRAFTRHPHEFSSADFFGSSDYIRSVRTTSLLHSFLRLADQKKWKWNSPPKKKWKTSCWRWWRRHECQQKHPSGSHRCELYFILRR